MNGDTKIVLLVFTSLFLFVSCSSRKSSSQIPTPQPTPSPDSSPVPFQRYGETLTDIPYCTTDASPQKMDVYFPGSGGPWPAVVYVHGGSWTHGDKSEAMMFAHLMTAQGYLVVSLNYRLYPAATFPAMIQDVKCAVRWLRAHAGDYHLDPDRIAAVGPSAGGHLVALLGTTEPGVGWDVGDHLEQSSRVQAVIAMAGVMDLSRNFPNADIESIKLIGFGEYNVVEASPISHVTPDDPPFLLIHGDRDELVPVEQSQLMYDRLVQTQVPAQLVIVQNATHSFIAPDGNTVPTLGEINQVILNFLTTYLQ